MHTAILQVDPKASYLAHKIQIDAAVMGVLESGWYLQGEQVKAFEAEYSSWNGLTHTIGVGSGTDALEVAMLVLDIRPGDEVITTTHTSNATVSAIELVGAVPVLLDIDPLTYTLDPAAVARAITPRTRAIIAVHLYGQPADFDPICALAQAHGLKVIEDCAQSHGARYNGRMVGTIGDIAAFSFYPTKNLGALGDGGAVGTMHDEQAARVRSLAQYGWRQRYIASEPGMNTRLDEIQAAVLRCKLRSLDADTARRQATAARYDAGLADVVSVPHVRPGSAHVYHLYVVRHPQRDALRSHLSALGIGTALHYPQPIHLHPAYRGRIADEGDCPVAEAYAREIISLPMYPELSDEKVDRVIEAIRSFPK